MDSRYSISRVRQAARWLMALVAAFAVIVLPASQARAQLSVLPGFDLWTTQPGTSFMGVPLVGVPLGVFDFGPPAGIQPTGTTDTIVQRLATASVPGPVLPPAQVAAPIPIEMVALQMMTAIPVDFGAGVGTYFVTLQSARGGGDPPPGPAATGTMTITFANTDTPPPDQPINGTFDSTLTVPFDIRFGGLAGPIVLSDTLILSSAGTGWSHFPDPNALLIDDVNNLLNGVDRLADFHPFPTVEIHPGVGVHQVGPTFEINQAAAPEPGSIGLLMLGIGLVGVGMLRWRL